MLKSRESEKESDKECVDKMGKTDIKMKSDSINTGTSPRSSGSTDSDIDFELRPHRKTKLQPTQPTQPHGKKYRNRRNILCCNCGRPGHVYKKCFQPITSIGVICIKTDSVLDPNILEEKRVPISRTPVSNSAIPETDLKYLFIRRKDSLSFAEIARARYKVNDQDYIRRMIVRMTRDEIEFLKNVKNADEIWYRLWTSKKSSKSRQNEYYRAKKKLQALIDGVSTAKGTFSFRSIINETDIRWEEPEWGFPKGRRNPKESDLECALREFQEETDIHASKISVLPVQPVEEVFTGSNGVRYKHIYYLATCKEPIEAKMNPKNKNQRAEVSAIAWLTPSEISQKIRGNYQERKKLVVYTTQYLARIRRESGTQNLTVPCDESTSESVDTRKEKNHKKA